MDINSNELKEIKVRVSKSLKTIVELSEKISRHYNVDSHTEVVFSNILGILNKELERLSNIRHKNQSILDIPINDRSKLELSTRAINVLEDNNIMKVGDILNYSKYQIGEFRNSGVKTVKEISDLINSLEIEWE